MSAQLTITIPVWLDFIFTCPLLTYRLLKFGYTYRRIDLGQGRFTIVEPLDYYRIRHFKWFVHGNGSNLYIRDKIYAETIMSLNFATSFVPLLKKGLNGHLPNYNLEIHVDVGEHGDTRDMIKEVVGMVTGNGFVAKTKPDAYGASYVADKHT